MTMGRNDIDRWVEEAKVTGSSGRPFFMLRNIFYRGMSEADIEAAIEELAENNDLAHRIANGQSQSNKVDKIAFLRQR
jgi:hypothetical protein